MDTCSGSIKWLSIREACEYLGVSRGTLYTYMQSDILPFYYLPNSTRRRIKQSDLDALLVRGKPTDTPAADDDETTT